MSTGQFAVSARCVLLHNRDTTTQMWCHRGLRWGVSELTHQLLLPIVRVNIYCKICTLALRRCWCWIRQERAMGAILLDFINLATHPSNAKKE